MDAEVPATTGGELESAGGAPEVGSSFGLTDDEILNPSDEGGEGSQTGEAPNAETGEGEEPDAPATPVVTKGAAEPQKTPEEQKAEEESRPVGDVEVPDHYNAVFKKHPGLEAAFYREKAYDEVFGAGGVPEARALRNLLPTLKDAQEAIAEASESLDFKSQVRSPSDFVKYVHSKNPAALDDLVDGFPDAVGRLAPKAYERLATRMWEDSLAVLDKMGAAREPQDEGRLALAARIIREELFAGRPTGSAREALRNDPEYQRYQEWQRTQGRGAAVEGQSEASSDQGFRNDVDRAYTADLVAEIGKRLDATGAALTPAAREELTGKIFRDVADQLNGNKWLTAQYGQRIVGKRDAAHKAEISKWLADRGKSLLPAAQKKVLSWYTKEFLGANGAVLSRKKNAATRRDVGPGSTGAAGGVPKVALGKPINYQKTSDDDIFAGRITTR